MATIQMYKLLMLNCLITAYSLSVQYLNSIKFGNYQMSIMGVLMSVCFLFEKLSREEPLGNIFNLYMLLSVLLQFALHIVSLVYITNLTHSYKLWWKQIKSGCLNTAIYLLGLSQQVSIFAINFQFKFQLTSMMVIDFVSCWVIKKICKCFFADLKPKPMITHGCKCREACRHVETEHATAAVVEAAATKSLAEKKAQ
ncbi:Cation-transporting ATPase 4 [Termitomyces sp. J132]|nr:Cation-transporting ATPase 4 [Termitomyces sp. J132]